MLKKHGTLLMALLVPLVTIVLIVASIYIPRSFSKPPNMSLLFAYNRYDSDVTYRLENEILREVKTPKPDFQVEPHADVKSQLYSYNVATEQLQELDFSTASKLGWKSEFSLPNNLSVKRGGGSFTFIFFDNVYRENWYLTGNTLSYKLNLPTSSDNTYYYTAEFLGWRRNE